jgi:8-oxo-dGTP diphosphatase
MKVRPSALILKGESVLTLRYNYGNVNVFALPGGNPDPGENLTDALARELTEELGISTQINSMVVSGEVIWPEVRREILHMVFASEITDGVPVLNPENTTALEIVWLPFSELCTKLLYPNVGRYLAKYLEGSRESVHAGVLDQPYIQ